MSSEIKRVAMPAVLRKGLECYRVDEADGHRYILRVPWDNETIEFEPWQIFILEVLPGCNDLASLFSVFEDRFGRKITEQEVDDLFAFVDEKKLFGTSIKQIPILTILNDWKTAKRTNKNEKMISEGLLSVSTGELSTATNGFANSKPEDKTSKHRRVSDTPDATNTSDLKMSKGIKLFNLRWLIDQILPVFRPLRYAVYLIPLLFISACLLGYHNFASIQYDYERLIGTTSIVFHIFFGMITVNLGATIMTALVAFNYRATVDGFYLVFYLFFIPRFAVRIGNIEQLKRNELIWIHLSPLLLRIGLFSFGVFLWYFFHVRHELLAFFGLAIMATGAISFFITANPLVKSNGYGILAASINEPKLRENSFAAFFGFFQRKKYSTTDPNLLVAYFLSSASFMIVLIGCLFFLISGFFKSDFGTSSLIIILSVAVIMIWRTVVKFRQIDDAQERSLQFDNWRNRTLSQSSNETDAKEVDKSANWIRNYCLRCLLVIVIACLFLPYDYEICGNVTILPNTEQQLSSDVAGIVEVINYDGGEAVRKGEIVGSLSNAEYKAQEKYYEAKIIEQSAVVEELKNRPQIEKVNLAESELKTQITRTKFSMSKVERLERLYKKGTINFEELEDARRIYEVDSQQVKEKRNKLSLIKLGATPEEIAEAEAQMKAFEEKRNFYSYQVQSTVFYMPSDGKIITTNLKNKLGTYLKVGEALALVQDTKWVKAEIEIAESDFNYLEINAPVRMRLSGYNENEIYCEVMSFNQDVTTLPNRKIVKIVSLIENHGDRLKAGMTGYAKIYATKMSVWQVIMHPLVRFVRVEVWSWFP